MNNFNYPKIHSLFKRDEKGKFTSEFSKPEFEYLYRNQWEATEKIDGTNIKVVWDGERVSFQGRTERAQIPTNLLSVLCDLFPVSKFWGIFGPTHVLLFGEGYGNKIQAIGKDYLPDGVNFIMFDCFIASRWLLRENLLELSESMEIDLVPHKGIISMEEAVHRTMMGFTSNIGGTKAEGLILKTPEGLLDRHGSRIITKLKTKDFV